MSKKRLLVEDLMSTAVISLKESDRLGRAQLEMHIAEIRHLPVVDGRNHVVGILSNRDLIRAIGKSDRMAVPVAEIMTRTVQTVRPTTPAHEAADMLIQSKIGCLPVVGEDLALVGIITETDFLTAARDALRGAQLGE